MSAEHFDIDSTPPQQNGWNFVRSIIVLGSIACLLIIVIIIRSIINTYSGSNQVSLTPENNTDDSKLWIIFYILITVMSYYLYKFKWSMSAFKVLTCLISILGIFGLIDYLFFRHMFCFKWLMLSVLALVSARIIWLRDVAKKFSAPDFLFQGHALWHVLTALSLMSLYFYLRSESAMPITKQKT